eukprot:TRINITY_DN2251_c0_g3_i3.p1 TRINITY_DN2251_c0_g3~~TRINITY_DN2251_c0_g3_i3.p1  ORF type:complete len:530 (-),score=192.19 TRINITY_DN2251_c0_g3_i3:414-1955(-)
MDEKQRKISVDYLLDPSITIDDLADIDSLELELGSRIDAPLNIKPITPDVKNLEGHRSRRMDEKQRKISVDYLLDPSITIDDLADIDSLELELGSRIDAPLNIKPITPDVKDLDDKLWNDLLLLDDMKDARPVTRGRSNTETTISNARTSLLDSMRVNRSDMEEKLGKIRIDAKDVLERRTPSPNPSSIPASRNQPIIPPTSTRSTPSKTLTQSTPPIQPNPSDSKTPRSPMLRTKSERVNLRLSSDSPSSRGPTPSSSHHASSQPSLRTDAPSRDTLSKSALMEGIFRRPRSTTEIQVGNSQNSQNSQGSHTNSQSSQRTLVPHRPPTLSEMSSRYPEKIHSLPRQLSQTNLKVQVESVKEVENPRRERRASISSSPPRPEILENSTFNSQVENSTSTSTSTPTSTPTSTSSSNRPRHSHTHSLSHIQDILEELQVENVKTSTSTSTSSSPGKKFSQEERAERSLSLQTIIDQHKIKRKNRYPMDRVSLISMMPMSMSMMATMSRGAKFFQV